MSKNTKNTDLQKQIQKQYQRTHEKYKSTKNTKPIPNNTQKIQICKNKYKKQHKRTHEK